MYTVREKIVLDGIALEQVTNFEYLDYSMSYSTSNDVNKLHKFNPVSYTHLDVYKRQVYTSSLV